MTGASLVGDARGDRPRDRVTFVSAALVMVTVAVVATLVPAWRTTRADPLAALREN